MYFGRITETGVYGAMHYFCCYWYGATTYFGVCNVRVSNVHTGLSIIFAATSTGRQRIFGSVTYGVSTYFPHTAYGATTYFRVQIIRGQDLF